MLFICLSIDICFVLYCVVLFCFFSISAVPNLFGFLSASQSPAKIGKERARTNKKSIFSFLKCNQTKGKLARKISRTVRIKRKKIFLSFGSLRPMVLKLSLPTRVLIHSYLKKNLEKYWKSLCWIIPSMNEVLDF